MYIESHIHIYIYEFIYSMYMYKIYIYCTYTHIIKMSKTNTGLTVLPQKHCPRDCMEFPPRPLKKLHPATSLDRVRFGSHSLGWGAASRALASRQFKGNLPYMSVQAVYGWWAGHFG